jgi:glucokinase
MPDKTCNYIVGVDLGGTNVRAAVTDKNAIILGEGHRPSLADEGSEATISQIIEAIHEAIDASGVEPGSICGIGMGVPGRHNSAEGIVLWSPNFKDLGTGVQILAPIRDEFGIPTYMGNDVNVAALGEFRFGAGIGISSMVMMTLGTGIGGAIILDGKLWAGVNEGGGEIGHQIINPNGMQCECGNFGDLEGEARRDSIVERALRKIYQGRRTVLAYKVEPKYYDLTPAMIAQAAAEGDQLSLEVMEETGYYIGIGVANAINFLNPEMVVIGGGIAQAGAVLWDPIMRTVRANAIERSLEVCRVIPAALGDNAGIMGGVVLVLQAMEG